MHSESPFWPIAQRLILNADIVANDDTPSREAKLSRMLRRWTPDPDGAAMILRPLLGLPDVFDVADRRAQTHRRRDTIDILIGQVLAAARNGPALLIFEDLQWADRGTLDVLRNLVGAIGDVPMLLVATIRDERTLRFGAAPNLLRIPLGRLDSATAAALIAETAGKRRLAHRTIETIVDRSDGVPLFVEEITKAVVEVAPEMEGTVPSTLRDSLIARLDVLPTIKAVAQIAACIGREFEESVLRQSADLAAEAIGEGLERLTNAGLLVAETGGRYRFRHAMLRDIAYETLLTPRRQSLHERCQDAGSHA
jgi:predicted ATPase